MFLCETCNEHLDVMFQRSGGAKATERTFDATIEQDCCEFCGCDFEQDDLIYEVEED